jgi:uncharacterized protein (TIGR03503 family)
MANTMNFLSTHNLKVHKRYSMIPMAKNFSIAAIIVLASFLAIGCYGVISEAVAQETPFAAQPSESLNAVLLLDSSASMLVNDPSKLRDQGARLLLQFLKSGDKLAIVRFDKSAELLRPLSPFVSDQLPAIQTTLNSIEASGQYTDLNAGLEAAQGILSKSPTSDSKSVIILLSDGKMDPAPGKGSVETHLDQLTTRILPAIKKAGSKVYTLAFSQDADKPLLQHIAQSTDGINWFTPNSDTIHESFADLFLSLKKPQVVPYGAKGFKIDADIDEATFYINQSEEVKIEIEDPNEERFSAEKPGDEIRWFDGKKFSVITISQPQAGEWKLIGVNPDDGFATILTNLKLVTDWPNAIPIDESVLLQARLYEGKLPVDLEAIAQAVNFAFQVTPSDRVSEPILREFLGDDGKNGDEKAGDGIFSRSIKLKDAGQYRLRLIAKGPTFERQLQLPFRVRPPLMTFTVVNPSEHVADKHGSVSENHQSGHAEEHAGSSISTDTHEHHEPNSHEDSVPKKHDEGKAPTNKQGIVEGSQFSILQVSLNEEASTLKNISITISAVDKEHNKYTVPAELVKNAHAGDEIVYQASAEALPKDGLFELRANLETHSRDGKKISEESTVVKFSRKTIVELTDKPIVKPTAQVVEKVEKPVEEGFEWLALVVVTILNLGLGALLYVLLNKKKAKAGDDSNFVIPSTPVELLSLLDDLDKRAQSETVNIDDEKFLVADGGSSSVEAVPLQTSEAESQEETSSENASE